jgi:inosose dehydratase
MNRRHFLQTGLLGSTALAAVSLPSSAVAALTKPAVDPFDGLKVGITSYTLRKFNLDQAIAMTKQAGVKYISLKDMHLPLNSTTSQRQEVRRKIESAGLILMGCGVVYLNNDEAEVRRAFEYAKEAGMPTIISSPVPEALDLVERAAKEYDIRVAIHNHGPGDQRYPSPLDVLRLVKDRDARMGLCMDVGHTVRIGVDPVAAIEQCASRLYDFHMKDVTAATPRGQPIAVGRGVIDIVGVLRGLLGIKYSYDVELEYEANADAPLPGMVESFGYLRGVLAAMV